MTLMQEGGHRKVLLVILTLAASGVISAFTLAMIMCRKDLVKKARLEYHRVSNLETQ